MTGLMIFAGLAVAGWITTFVTSALAPVGYQDEDAFHYGAPARYAMEDVSAATDGQCGRAGESSWRI